MDGAVLVADDGRIAAVGAHAQVPDPPGARRVEFPDAVLVPGLVNTHTHLELTHLAGRNPEREFSRWIRTIRALKDATTPEEFDHSAEQGVRDCWMAGVTCVADTGSTGAPLRALARLGPVASGRARLGVSPHAPYTVSEPLYRAVAAFARREALPLAVHLAESREETALVRDGAGSFAEALRARGIPVQPHRCSPAQYLLHLGVLERATGWLCIHCVQVDEKDIRTLKESGAGLAACPRSNRAHAHDRRGPRARARPRDRLARGREAGGSCGVSLHRPPPPSTVFLRPPHRRRRPPCSRLHSRPMKTQRHAAILKIVRSQTVASQEQLRELLKSEGF